MSTALALQNENMDRYMAEISHYPLLTREEEQELARRYHTHGEVSAAHRLVVSNLRFVVKIAHEYRGYGLKLLDLIQEGNIGLMVAVKKFDPDKGYRLISYAVWWIRAYMQSFIMRSWSLVRLGASRVQRKLFFKLRSERSKAQAEAEQQGFEPVSTREMAERLGVDEDDVMDMELRLAARDFSLDAKVSDEATVSHVDLLPDATVSQEDELASLQEQRLLRGKVEETMGVLNEKERYIVEKRLLSDEPQTLQEIGDNFRVSRERVRQLENRVLSKLRAALADRVDASV
jgi:RNA polymerase sigma-32 factor